MRCLVLSDLHCTTQGRSSERSFLRPEILRNPWNKHPIEALLRLREDIDLPLDALLCPGDVTDQIDRNGLTFGVSALTEIADAFGCELLLSSIGNHDTDSRARHQADLKSSDALLLAKNIHPERYPVPKGPEQDRFWAHGVSMHACSDCWILNLNSVHHASNETLGKRGIMHEQQLGVIREILESKKDELAAKPWVCMVHHHPLPHELHGLGGDDLMENGEHLLSLLAEYKCDLVIHGHKHHSRMTYYEGAVGVRLPVFSAGSFSEQLYPELAQRACNNFHIIKISEKGRGEIENWRLLLGHGWIPCNPSACGIEYKYGFSARNNYDRVHSDLLAYLLEKSEDQILWSIVCRDFPEVNYLSTKELFNLEGDLMSAGFVLIRQKGVPERFCKLLPID